MYKLSNGIEIYDNGTILDKRLDMTYNNNILTLFLLDIKKCNITDLENYLDNMDIDQLDKHEVKKCINFCLKMNLIKKQKVLFKKVIWNEKRILMQIEFILTLFIFFLPLIPMIIINGFYNLFGLKIMINFYLLHLFSIYIHECFHSMFLWKYEKKFNGYYIVNLISCSLVYSIQNIKFQYQNLIALSGSLLTITILFLLQVIYSEFSIIIIIEILIQLFSLIFGDDGKIIKRNKKFKQKR